MSNICHFSCHDLGFRTFIQSPKMHRTLNLLSPEHRCPVTRGGEGGGGAGGPRGGRVVEGGQVGDCRGAGHRDGGENLFRQSGIT